MIGVPVPCCHVPRTPQQPFVVSFHQLKSYDPGSSFFPFEPSAQQMNSKAHPETPLNKNAKLSHPVISDVILFPDTTRSPTTVEGQWREQIPNAARIHTEVFFAPTKVRISSASSSTISIASIRISLGRRHGIAALSSQR
jgi:hypothetical protein